MKLCNLIAPWAVAAALAPVAPACSSDTDNDPQGEIQLDATVETPTGIGTETMINGSTMVVSAFTALDTDNPVTVMADAMASKRDGSWSYDPVAWWPTEAVDFYAYSPMSTDVAPEITATSQRMQYVCDGREDLLYASTKGLKKSTGTVYMNFRHALARVNVDFCTDATTMAVYVGVVTLRGINNIATFTWPSAHTSAGSLRIPGIWTPQNPAPADVASIVYTLNDMPVEPEPLAKEPVNLNSTMARYFLPQHLTSEARVTVQVQVRDAATGRILLPQGATSAADYATVSFPLVRDQGAYWLEGTAYTYTVDLTPTAAPVAVTPKVTVAQSTF